MRAGRSTGVGLALGLGLLLLLPDESPRAVLDRARVPRGPLPRLPGWPLDPGLITRIGDALGASRGHQGVDLFVPAGTEVLAPEDLRIVRAIDGSHGTEKQQAAGQWVDAEGTSGLLLRFLHLVPGPPVKAGDRLNRGQRIGHVAPTGSSGVKNSPPHLHFEVRSKAAPGEVYGAPLDPLSVLPEVGIALLDKRIAAARKTGVG